MDDTKIECALYIDSLELFQGFESFILVQLTNQKSKMNRASATSALFHSINYAAGGF
jgi:hypothetical protein